MNKTKIDYCDYTWNPMTGCLHGCPYCYARGIARRFAPKEAPDCDRIAYDERHGAQLFEIGHHFNKGLPFPFGFSPTLYWDRLEQPQQVKRPSTIFVCSVSDLGGAWVPLHWLEAIMRAMAAAPQHRYLLLTKDPGHLDQVRRGGHMEPLWGLKVLYGSSAENQAALLKRGQGLGRLQREGLLRTWLSLEPLLGPMDLPSLGYQPSWVAVGAMTGPGAVRPATEWVERILADCQAMGVPVWLKDNLLAALPGLPRVQQTPWQ